MRTKNAMQLKAYIRNKAQKNGVAPQLMMQNYLHERLLERISLSPWKDNVVIKGGVLISSLVGNEKRTTYDLDTTVQGFQLTHESAEKAFREIVSIEVDDGFSFSFVRTEDIRETDDYPGIRVHLVAKYEKIKASLTVDVTTGDRITPNAIEYCYHLLFDNRSVALMAYPLATILAEKLETVISREASNTRPRDYYDLHTLWIMRSNEVDPSVLKEALIATAKKRNTLENIDKYCEVLELVSQDGSMLNLWSKYARKYSYVGNLTLQDTCRTIKGIMDAVWHQ